MGGIEPTGWPSADGEMAARIRAHDWAGTPLGRPDSWSGALRTLVEVMLAAPQIATLAVGPERIFLYNDHAAGLYGHRHPDVLGRPLQQAFPEEFHKVAGFYDRVFAGEGVHIPGQALDPADTGTPEVFDAYLTPVRGADGSVEIAYMTGVAMGERVRAEAMLAADLADATRLRDLADRLVSEDSVEATYQEVLTAAMAITRADAGMVQLYDPASHALVLLAMRNFDAATTDFFCCVDADSRTVSGMALRTGARTFTDFDGADTDLDCAMHVRAGFLSAQATPLVSRSGRPLGMLSSHWQAANHRPNERELRFLDLLARQAADLIEQRQAQAALRESEEQQRLTLQLVPALLWRADAVGSEITITDRWQAYTGQSEAEIQNFGWLDAIHPDDLPATRAAFEHAFATGEPLECQHRIRHAGNGYRWHLVRHVPLRDATGTITRWFGAAIDVEEIRQLQDRQGVLVAELQHRTRNLITVVRALSHRTLQSAGSLEEFGRSFNRRLEALSRVQGLLSHLVVGQSITFDELLRSELSALGAPDDKLTLDGPAGVPLRSATVQTFALALHELATNAVKHGALAGADGHLAIRWTSSHDGPAPRLHVDWCETGVIMCRLDGQARERGYGRELIEQALPYQLGAETTYALTADGVHCTIDVPIAPARSPRASTGD